MTQLVLRHNASASATLAQLRIAAIGVSLAIVTACAVRIVPRPPPPPPPVAGEPVQFWERDVETATGIGRVIWARNDTTVAVTITMLTLFDCFNVNPACGEKRMSQVLAPGKTAEVLTLRADDPARGGGSFRYKFDVRYEWRDPVK